MRDFFLLTLGGECGIVVEKYKQCTRGKIAMTTTNLTNLGVLADWCEENLPECTTWVREGMDIWCDKYSHYFELIEYNAPRDLLYAAVRELVDRRELIRTDPVVNLRDTDGFLHTDAKKILRPQHPC